MSDLKPYSGKDAQCTKCGEHGARSLHRDLVLIEDDDSDSRFLNDIKLVAKRDWDLSDEVTEIQERRCGNCGYEWVEDVYRAG